MSTQETQTDDLQLTSTSQSLLEGLSSDDLLLESLSNGSNDSSETEFSEASADGEEESDNDDLTDWNSEDMFDSSFCSDRRPSPAVSSPRLQNPTYSYDSGQNSSILFSSEESMNTLSSEGESQDSYISVEIPEPWDGPNYHEQEIILHQMISEILTNDVVVDPRDDYQSNSEEFGGSEENLDF